MWNMSRTTWKNATKMIPLRPMCSCRCWMLPLWSFILSIISMLPVHGCYLGLLFHPLISIRLVVRSDFLLSLSHMLHFVVFMSARAPIVPIHIPQCDVSFWKPSFSCFHFVMSHSSWFRPRFPNNFAFVLNHGSCCFKLPQSLAWLFLSSLAVKPLFGVCIYIHT